MLKCVVKQKLTIMIEMQFIPKDGLYIYFRYDNKQTVMVVANTSDKTVKPDWNHFGERTKGFSKIRDVVTGKICGLSELEINAGESAVYELLK